MRRTKSRPTGLDLRGNGEVVPTEDQLAAAWNLYTRVMYWAEGNCMARPRKMAQAAPYKRTRVKARTKHAWAVAARAWERYEAMYLLFHTVYPDA